MEGKFGHNYNFINDRTVLEAKLVWQIMALMIGSKKEVKNSSPELFYQIFKKFIQRNSHVVLLLHEMAKAFGADDPSRCENLENCLISGRKSRNKPAISYFKMFMSSQPGYFSQNAGYKCVVRYNEKVYKVLLIKNDDRTEFVEDPDFIVDLTVKAWESLKRDPALLDFLDDIKQICAEAKNPALRDIINGPPNQPSPSKQEKTSGPDVKEAKPAPSKKTGQRSETKGSQSNYAKSGQRSDAKSGAKGNNEKLSYAKVLANLQKAETKPEKTDEDPKKAKKPTGKVKGFGPGKKYKDVLEKSGENNEAKEETKPLDDTSSEASKEDLADEKKPELGMIDGQHAELPAKEANEVAPKEVNEVSSQKANEVAPKEAKEEKSGNSTPEPQVHEASRVYVAPSDHYPAPTYGYPPPSGGYGPPPPGVICVPPGAQVYIVTHPSCPEEGYNQQ